MLKGDTSLFIDEGSLRRLYRLLKFDSTNMAEVRIIDVNNEERKWPVYRGVVKSENEFMTKLRQYNGMGNCFVGRNPRNEKLEVCGISSVSIDIDPIYDKLKGATQEQTDECFEVAEEILQVFKGGIPCCSGNGVLLLYPFCEQDKPTPELQKLIEEFEDECRKIAKLKKVRIDNTHDHARLIKCIGTTSVKGGNRRTYFSYLPNYERIGGRLSSYLESNGIRQSATQGQLLAKSTYPSRSEADYALAVHYKQSGITDPNECLSALSKHVLGRNNRRDDHIRIVEKVYHVLWDNNSRSFANNPVANIPDVSVHTPATSLQEYIEYSKLRNERKTPELPTGFQTLDSVTFGLKRGMVQTIAAEPSVGKTSWCLNAIINLCKEGKSVLMLSTEMNYRDIWDRIIAIGAGISGTSLERGTLTDEEKLRKDEFLAKFMHYRLSIVDSMCPDEKSVRQVATLYSPDVLVFDFIQMIGQGDAQGLSNFMSGIKELTRELNCATILVSQFSRLPSILDYNTKQLTRPKPSMFNLKGSSSIEQGSDRVMLLHRTGANLDEGVPIVECYFEKNKNGPLVTSNMAFFGSTYTFKEV